MAKRKRLTNSADETEIGSLLSGDSVFVVPYFQRAYKWRPKRLKQLNQDLLNLVDQSNDFHFLGAIIIHGRRSNPSEPDAYEVIDGQQRITTLYIYLCAIVRVLAEEKQYGEAEGLLHKYLLISRDTGLITNAKLQPCKDDRAQLNYVLGHVVGEGTFAEKLAPLTFRPMPSTGPDRGRLRNNYRSALRFFREQTEKEGLRRMRRLYEALLTLMSVVQIDVWDPTNGPKIFDSLNSRQEPMTTGDLVRNEIFSRLAGQSPEEIELMDERSWQPFYGKFKTDKRNLFDDYFFPYGLIQDPNLRKSEVYQHLRDGWTEIKDPERIVEKLQVYQDAFLDIVLGKNLKDHPKKVARPMRSLHSSRPPSSTYPFLMQLSNGIADGSVSAEEGVEVIRLIESFLVRRAITGHEPTGLHAVFKKLWKDCNGHPTAASVEKAIRVHKTVVWPSDEAVMKSVKSRALYGVGITPHILGKYNESLGGDEPATIPWIEHVLPEKPQKEWFKWFSDEEHRGMKDLLANLLPLSEEMNRKLGNKPYVEKRAVYAKDSGFKAARQFAEDYPVAWTPDLLTERSERLAEWVVSEWPF